MRTGRLAMAEFRSNLRVPSHPDSATIVGAYVREFVDLARLPPEHAEHLVLAAIESCSGIVGGADAPSAQEPLDLVAILTPKSLTLEIHERGAPFDPSDTTAGALAPPFVVPPGSASGTRWTRPAGSIAAAPGWSCISPRIAAKATSRSILPRASSRHFRMRSRSRLRSRTPIRRFRPDDAIGVAQCVYRSFGYTYGDADLYYPDRIVHLNETGQLVSIVALDEAGAIVGHLGLERPELGAIAESSDAAVAPAHRHRHLLERLRAFAEDEARGIGLEGLVGYPVTTHPFSQRMDEAVGAHLCGVVLGQLPRSTSFKGIATEPIHERVSTLLYFKYLGAPSPTIVHAPTHHRAMLERLYANLAVPAEFRAPDVAAGAGRLVVSLDRQWGFGEVQVQSVGADTATEIRRARADLCAVAGTEVVYLYLPLAQPGTPELCARAEAEGFFFSGIGPGFANDSDALCLQYVGGELDPRLLQIATRSAASSSTT